VARDFIKINVTDGAATHAAALLSYKNALRAAYDQGKRLQSIMGHNHDGTIFTDIETLFGLPVGKGQQVFDLVNGSIGAMEGILTNDDAKQLTEQVG
jgi:hypothetical protein